MNLYRKDGDAFVKIDLLAEIVGVVYSQTLLDWSLYVGNKRYKTPVRLLLARAPEEVANQRRAKVKEQARKKGKPPTNLSLALCHWSLWITNIPEDKGLDVPTLLALYPLRWSIELFFKQTKSILKVHKSGVRSNPHRLRCEIIGTCIVALFITFCYAGARSQAWRQLQREVSFEKTVKHFRRNIADLTAILFGHASQDLSAYIRDQIRNILRLCLKGRQKTRTNSLDALLDPVRFQDHEIIAISRNASGKLADSIALAA